jgi:2-polyprenyl-3-methyl-5-hydroxy-6-metoxy-1,4-benzoquinol methylase
VNFLHRQQQERGSYNKEYFSGKYEAQYGKSYLQDEPNIRNFARERIIVLEKILGHPLKGSDLLDAGCAFGFFLDESRKRGATVTGLELIPDAVRYARRRLHLKVLHEDLATFSPLRNSYDVITLWYVLEHFKDPDRILLRMTQALRPGGILALSVPHSRGYSFLCDMKSALKERPRDHYFDFSIRSFKFIARLYGLRVVKIVVRGIHWTRFRQRCRLFSWLPDGKIFHQLFSSICRILRLGDTMEVYLRKG